MSAVLGINNSNRPNAGLARFKTTIHLPEEKPSFGQKNEIQKIALLQKNQFTQDSIQVHETRSN